jgi:ribose transport system ATP-binding protein
MADAAAVVEMRGVVKEFPGQVAINGVDLTLLEGEIHGLVGENGSGKSTLIKCLAGFHEIDQGEIAIDGEVPSSYSVPVAHAAGLRFIYQDPAVFPSLTVGENLAIADEFSHGSRVRIDWQDEGAAARDALSLLGVDIDLETRVRDLTPARRAMVAVAMALVPGPDGQPARLLVFDEPTAALPEHEVESLFRVIRAAAARGVAVLYVSHRIEEIFALTDKVTVLRDAKVIATTETAQLTEARLVAQIIGEPDEVFQVGTRVAREAAPVRLKVEGLSSGRLRDIGFEVHRGEILGIAGLLGSGRSRIARCLFGAEDRTAGTFELDGEPLEVGSPSDAIAAGMALVPEDRRHQSAFNSMPVATNLTIADVSRYVRFTRVSPRLERRDVASLMDEHDVRPRQPDRSISLLSGGNQQKVMLARWIRLAPKVMILDEPTQGIDIQAKEEILKLVDELSDKGVATLFISSDHTEYARICDRVIVLRGGGIAGELRGDQITPLNIADLAFLTSATSSAA